MPEGPEVQITIEFLNKYLSENLIEKIDINSGRYIKQDPKGWDKLVLPLKVLNVNSKGKFIYFECIDINKNPVYIFNTLGLTGMWSTQIIDKNNTHLTFTILIKNNKKIIQKNIKKENLSSPPIGSDLYLPILNFKKINIIDKNKFELYFADVRRFGTFSFIFSKEELDKKLSKIGPDLLKENIKKDEWEKIKNRAKNKKLVEFLMEQKFISGIGNYLSAELMYRVKLSPYTLIKNIDENVWNNLLNEIKKVMCDSYFSQGGTIKFCDFVPTKFKFNVYMKDECEKGHKIKKDKIIKGRTTYWCPIEQK